MTFAIITPALIIGAYVERIRLAVLIFLGYGYWLFMPLLPIGFGWLYDSDGRMIFCGIVVHATAGTAALVAAL